MLWLFWLWFLVIILIRMASSRPMWTDWLTSMVYLTWYQRVNSLSTDVMCTRQLSTKPVNQFLWYVHYCLELAIMIKISIGPTNLLPNQSFQFGGLCDSRTTHLWNKLVLSYSAYTLKYCNNMIILPWTYGLNDNVIWICWWIYSNLHSIFFIYFFILVF